MSEYNCNFDDIDEVKKYIPTHRNLLYNMFRGMTDHNIVIHVQRKCPYIKFSNAPLIFFPSNQEDGPQIQTTRDDILCRLIENCMFNNDNNDLNIIKNCIHNATFPDCEKKEEMYKEINPIKEEKAAEEKAATDTRLKNIIIIIFFVIILIIIGVFIYIYFFSKKPVIDNNYFENDEVDS